MKKDKELLMSEEQESQKKKSNVVVVLGAAVVICAIVLTVVLFAVIPEIGNKELTRYEVTITANNPYASTEGNFFEDYNIPGNDTVGNAEEQQTGNNGEVVQNTKHELVEQYEHLSVNGENRLSDHYGNEYIQIISSQYNVNADLLVAIYSVPDSGTNFVLEFSDIKNSNGEYIKSPATLKKVYQIDKNKNVKVATGTNKGNEGVSYAESVICFELVKNTVMKQYPNYFTGL